jgi:hypothetical protein
MTDLGDLFKAASQEKRKLKEEQENTQAGKALKALQERLKANNDIGEMMEIFVEKKPKEIIKEVIVEKEVIKEVVVNKDSFQQPATQLIDPNFAALTKKIQFLEQAIGRIAATGPGSGEVNLRYLDDVNRSSIANNLYLRYDSPSKKFTFDHGHTNTFHGTFQSTQNQYSGASTASSLTFNVTDLSYGVTIVDGSKVTLENPGVYNVQFSVQCTNSGNQIDSVYVWNSQNGVDIPGSTGKFDIPASHGGVDGALLIGWNFFISTVSPNEYFEFRWFTADETHVIIPYLPAQAAVPGVSPSIPSTASVVLTVTAVNLT